MTANENTSSAAPDRQAEETLRECGTATIEGQLRQFLTLLNEDGGLRETRALDAKRSKYPYKTPHTEHGYFRPADIQALLFAAAHFRGDHEARLLSKDLGSLDGKPKGVYYTLNPVKAGAFARSPAGMSAGRGVAATRDEEVERRTRFLIDVDAPREVSNVSASETEKGEALQLCEEVKAFLRDRGWPEPVEIDSGNGYQLIFAIDLPADDGGLIQRVLQSLAAQFPRPDGGIDTAVYNPARIARLPGTWNCKGHDTYERPHRLAQVLSLPETLEPVSEAQLAALAALSNEDPAPNQKSTSHSSTKGRASTPFQDAVDRWIADHPRTYPQSGSQCPICDSPDGFKAGPGDSARWACFSSRHAELTGDKHVGRGCPGSGCFTGDALDIEAWTSKRTRKQVLQDDNYLQARTRSGQGPQPDSDCNDLVPLGDRDPNTGRVVLSPRRTLPTAQAFLDKNYSHGSLYTLVGYADKLWRWTGNRYEQVENEAIRNQLYPWLHDALRYIRDPKTKLPRLVDFESNPGAVKNTLATIQAETFLPANVEVPFWRGDGDPPAPLHELLPCQSKTLHIPSRQVFAATPELFAINALEFDYDSSAPTPIRWLAFLEQLFGNDIEAVELLQEWMGYCLTCDTSQQKMLLLIGPRRSGKGTIARVLRSLVGNGNAVGPTVSSLAMPFGMQQLLGKTNAIVSDARFAGDRMTVVVELLLCISGEDAISVDRKFLEPVNLTLPVRFTFLTNELPTLRDASSALAGRFLVLRLTKSFYDEEDTKLTSELLEELPGILQWALEGLERLGTRGHFVQPASSQQEMQDLEDLSSPVMAFVREACVLAPGQRVDCKDLYRGWVAWCGQRGLDNPPSQAAFGRDLKAATNLSRRRHRGGTGFYEGIGLRRKEEDR